MNAKTDSVLGDCVDWRPRDLLLDTFSHCGRLDHKKHTHARLSPRSHFHCSIYDAIVLLEIIDYWRCCLNGGLKEVYHIPSPWTEPFLKQQQPNWWRPEKEFSQQMKAMEQCQTAFKALA
jgi:hypothetical protein